MSPDVLTVLWFSDCISFTFTCEKLTQPLILPPTLNVEKRIGLIGLLVRFYQTAFEPANYFKCNNGDRRPMSMLWKCCCLQVWRCNYEFRIEIHIIFKGDCVRRPVSGFFFPKLDGLMSDIPQCHCMVSETKDISSHHISDLIIFCHYIMSSYIFILYHHIIIHIPLYITKFLYLALATSSTWHHLALEERNGLKGPLA